MKNYKEMSDFEINNLVGLHLKLRIAASHEDVDTGDRFILGNTQEEMTSFNPCNNPSDAWPIIQRYKISLYLDDGDSYAFYGENINPYMGSVESYDYEYNDSNILRAAMVVFLMMKEKE